MEARVSVATLWPGGVSAVQGGQAQRVSLAISIALRPQVLLLDEPTSACDMDATLRWAAVGGEGVGRGVLGGGA